MFVFTAAGTASKGGRWRAGQYGRTQGHPGMGGGGGYTYGYGTAEELSIQLERGDTGVMQTKWRSIVEGVVICS